MLTQQAGDQVDLNANPPPKVVNAVLPSEASLTRGQALYAIGVRAVAGERTICRNWCGGLPRLRDEDLYAAVTRDGWWSLPPCSGRLQRRAVVGRGELSALTGSR